MPRTFTPAELARLTIGEYKRLSHDDQDAYNRALWAAMSEDDRYLAGDYDRIASHRRFELGE